MSKGLSLWFACSSILLLAAAAIAMSYNGWIAVLLGVIAIGNIGWGFVIKAKKNRINGPEPE
ncbi:hypothetical protein J23TS9_48010 [Paenibacillus sp. J23TS9]|uniref:hypothetical protein n=1 Tax=Paenibacillus sp. J23TS9 TaxID=2807193 RepID=UPI001B08E83A|nr:hypothetical protein [Paenibacillus sp. J23TS9]GIP29671.1 hypothetical protein J23TS9_48010 [Paenibacillus sp. J23TS9]